MPTARRIRRGRGAVRRRRRGFKGFPAAALAAAETASAALDAELKAQAEKFSLTRSYTKAAELATALMGDSIATNMFMLGYAWQRGWIPVGRDALLRAISLNGVHDVPSHRAMYLAGTSPA